MRSAMIDLPQTGVSKGCQVLNELTSDVMVVTPVGL
jgi:hypothetical protein